MRIGWKDTMGKAEKVEGGKKGRGGGEKPHEFRDFTCPFRRTALATS